MTARRIERSESSMPVLSRIRDEWSRDAPLAGVRVVACLPVTAETGALARTLRAGGARLALCSSNPPSTQEDVAAALRSEGVEVFARRRVDRDGYYADVRAALATLDDLHGPDDLDDPGTTGRAVLLDDGCDLIGTLHDERADLLATGRIVGASEQTASGVVRLRQLARSGALGLPVVALSGTPTKRLVDNRWGSGQSTVDALLRATGALLAGKVCVVAGFGDVGRGVAERLRGMGSQVLVTEVDPVAALEAALSGYRVLPMLQAVPLADVVVTATGGRDVVAAEHIALLKNGVVLANAGHFDVEVDVRALAAAAVRRQRNVRPALDGFTLRDGRRVLLVGEGRVAGLAAAEGSPPAVMDLAFALQALAVDWLLQAAPRLSVDVHPLPDAIDREVARLALQSLGVDLDVLTAEQAAYLQSWRSGS